MEALVATIVVVGLLFFFLGSGLWLFIGLILTSLASLVALTDFSLVRIGTIVKPIIINSVSSWELAAIPLFLWMGEIINRSDISDRLFRGVTPWVVRLPGGLLHTNIAGCVLFAAVSGSSAATTATVGKITTQALRERDYDPGLSTGSIAAAGSIGIMIPPSLTMIVYGVVAEVSIAKLFAAGLFPGLFLGALYSGYILMRCVVSPDLAPAADLRPSLADRLRSVTDLVPIFILIVILLGGIYSGIATPSEAAAVGVTAALAITLPYRRLGWTDLATSAVNAVKTTCFLGTAIAAAKLLATTMGFLHIPQTVATFIGSFQLSPSGLLVVLGLFYILLGCVLEAIAMVLMTMPIALPLIAQAGIDPVWFGIFIVLMVEMGLVTPPIGLNLFIIRSISGQSIATIALGAFPFFLLMILASIIFTVFPQIVLWLPQALF